MTRNSAGRGTSIRNGQTAAHNGQTAAVYERLRELIVRGELAPGARLIERDISTRLGTSRTPVRSVLQRLQQERYVTALDSGKHARLVVAPLTMDDARELFEVVGGVEAAAARRAALLSLPMRVRLCTELVQFNDALLQVTRQAKPDHNEIFELDAAFHRTYVEAGAGPRIIALHNVVKPQAERCIRVYISALVDQIADSIRGHAMVIDALRNGDADVTQDTVLRNWRNAAARFSEAVTRFGERGNW